MNRAPDFARVPIRMGSIVVYEGKQYLVTNASLAEGKSYFEIQPYTHPVQVQMRHALEKMDGNVSRVAQNVGMSRDAVRALLEKYGLVDYANELRVKAGGAITVEGKHEGRVTGRPKKTSVKR
jgi:hypothetical protein